MLDKCNLCSWNCNVDRNVSLGKCKCPSLPKLARASLHFWEEPCISGTKGSGTVFFSGCNFNCIFCQNYSISQEHFGKEISTQDLANIFLKLQSMGAHNINLVSPTPYVLQIIESIKIAKTNGLIIPIVYNTNSYETVQTIKLLDGYVDIYLPDLKYFDDEIAMKYSKCPNYFKTASDAILEMFRQVGLPKFNDDGIVERGVIIRHLVLPNNLMQTKKILNWIKNNFSDDVYVSIMAQYFPTYLAKDDVTLNRKLSKKEYSFVSKLAAEFKNGYIQDLGSHEEEYVPEFDLSGL